MQGYRTQAVKRISEVLNLAFQLYGFKEPVTPILRNTGRAAGKASRDHAGRYSLIINTQLLTEATIDELLNETIPHEVAHLVCFWNPILGRNHDAGWRRVCKALGGSGKRCHAMPVQKARRTRKAIYEINGKEIPVGLTRHKRIMARTHTYHIASCGTSIKPDHFTGRIILD